MSITEHRFITFSDKIITLANVRKLANELYAIYKKKGKDKYKSIKFEVSCAGKAIFTSEDPKIFADNSPIVSKRVLFVEMQLYFESGDYVKVKLEHNPVHSYDNKITVIGDNSNWVNGTLKRLEEIVDEFNPQSTLIKRYGVLLFLVLSFTIGLAFINIEFLLLNWAFPSGLIPFTPSARTIEWVRNHITLVIVLLYLAKYITAFFIGSSPAASIMKRLDRMFPSVELQIGPEHKLTEKRQREQIANIVSITGVVSLLLQIVYDFAVSLF